MLEQPLTLAEQVKLVRQYAQELQDQGYVSYPWEYEEISSALFAICDVADVAQGRLALVDDYAGFYSVAVQQFSVTGEVPLTFAEWLEEPLEDAKEGE
jgi:hypothetical protein